MLTGGIMMKSYYNLFFLLLFITGLFFSTGCPLKVYPAEDSNNSEDSKDSGDPIEEFIPGTKDDTFNYGGSGLGNNPATLIIYSVITQPDDKIIIGGAFSSYNGVLKNNFTRLNSDGTLDMTFNSGISGATETDGDVNTIALQSNGKILIGGSFNYYNTTYRHNFARINSNGSLDTAFNPVNGPNSGVYAIAVQSDNKIIIAGTFTSYNGINRNYIARINTDGSLDTTFNYGNGPNDVVNDIKIQLDGKILIAGDFTTYDNISRNYIARLNSNGTLDTSFTTVPGADYIIITMALQNDGKILIGGWFTSYDGVSRNCIARILTSGSFDPSFSPGSGFSGSLVLINKILLQQDGKILVAGYFSSYNGITRNNIVRLNPDGSLDTSFDQGSGTDAPIRGMDFQSDGKIVIGGDFTSYNGSSSNHIARIHGGD